MTEEKQVSITESEYAYLLGRDLHLSILEARGVDNWQGFTHAPERKYWPDDESYNKEVERRMNYLD